MAVQESPDAAPESAAPPERYFTVWKDAPLRPVPFVRRADGEKDVKLTANPDNSEFVDTLRKGSGPWLAYAQCRGAWVEHDGYWNDFWLLTTGPSGYSGWVSMVDVDEPGNGAPKQNVPISWYQWVPAEAG